MINRAMLDKSMGQIATNSIGRLQSVDGNKATVVINDQVYPDMMLVEVFDCDEFECKSPVNNANIKFKPFDWSNYIGRQVLVTLLDRDPTNGVVVGVIK